MVYEILAIRFLNSGAKIFNDISEFHCLW